MTEMHVTAHGLQEAAAKLRQADHIMRQEFQSEMGKAVQPIIRAARANALATLPKRGGYAAVVAASNFHVTLLRGYLAGIRIATGDHDKRLDTQGRLRHPVYGHWRSGVPSQKVPPGWFTHAARQAAPAVRALMLHASRTIAKRIAG